MKLAFLTFSWVFCGLWLAMPTVAQTPASELDELRRRIEALEQQNAALLEALNGESLDQFGPMLQLAEPPADRKSSEVADLELSAEPWTDSEFCEECFPEEKAEKDPLGMTASWHHGLEIATKDKNFRVHIGGRTQLDVGWFNADQNVQDNINRPYENGADFRRGRIRIDGTMYSTIEWAVEYDFFNSFDDNGESRAITAPTDLWWQFKEVPWVGNIRIGNQKPAIGFEHLVSSRFLPFMERSYNQDAFYGGRYNGFLPGVAMFDNWGANDLGTWNAGLFKPTDNVFAENAFSGDVAGVGRVSRLLWYENDGANLFHVGGSVWGSTTVEDVAVFRTRDAIRTGLSADWPVPATTGPLTGDDIVWLNGELAAVDGPWTFQSEYLVSEMSDAAMILGGVPQPSPGDVVYHGGYVQVMYFITGEHDRYNKLYGTFERVIPHRNFYFRRGCGAAGPGAWQIGARYNYLDLNDNTIDGGILHNVTVGLNWFFNPNMKMQFNYMCTDRDAALGGDLGDGIIHGWGIRFAQDF